MEYQHIYVISKFSPIFPKGFKEFFHDIYIHTSPDFSHRVFRGVFPYKDQTTIGYKTTRRTHWLQDLKKDKLIKGECYEEIRISDQFL